eukprot:Skav235618  [mRNA]  locus=scaffold358:193397:196457:- [translate_table: standard]
MPQIGFVQLIIQVCNNLLQAWECLNGLPCANLGIWSTTLHPARLDFVTALDVSVEHVGIFNSDDSLHLKTCRQPWDSTGLDTCTSSTSLAMLIRWAQAVLGWSCLVRVVHQILELPEVLVFHISKFIEGQSPPFQGNFDRYISNIGRRAPIVRQILLRRGR